MTEEQYYEEFRKFLRYMVTLKTEDAQREDAQRSELATTDDKNDNTKKDI